MLEGIARIQRRGALPLLLLGAIAYVISFLVEPHLHAVTVLLVAPLQLGWGGLGIALWLGARATRPVTDTLAMNAALVVFAATALIRYAAIRWA